MTEDSFKLLSALAHDLRNPLTAIKGHTQILLRRLKRQEPDLEQLTATLGQMEQAASRMQEMLAEFVDIARVCSHQRLDMTLQQVDLVATVESAVTSIATENPECKFTVRSTRERIIGEWDQVRLQRAIRILLGEVAAHSDLTAEIQAVIEVGRDGSARLGLMTRGTGEPQAAPGQEALVFDPLAVAEETDLKVKAALTFAGTIVDLLGGKLVRSGLTQFSLTLPVLDRVSRLQ